MTVVDKEHVLLDAFDVFVFRYRFVVLEIVINMFHQGGNFRSHTMLYIESLAVKTDFNHSLEQ